MPGMPNTLTNGRSDPARSAALQRESRRDGILPEAINILDDECDSCGRLFLPVPSSATTCPKCTRAQR